MEPPSLVGKYRIIIFLFLLLIFAIYLDADIFIINIIKFYFFLDKNSIM